MENSEIIGKLVLSSAFGVGKVLGVECIGGDRDFLVVECEQKRVKNYLPMDGEQNYRFVSSKQKLKKLLGSNPTPSQSDFESKKDRIDYFKEKSKLQNAATIWELLQQIISLNDRGSVENQIYSKLVDSLALEHSLATGDEVGESRKMIIEILEGE